MIILVFCLVWFACFAFCLVAFVCAFPCLMFAVDVVFDFVCGIVGVWFSSGLVCFAALLFFYVCWAFSGVVY